MKNKLTTYLNEMGKIAGIDGKNLLDIVREENKTKKYTLNPIVLKVEDGTIVTNSSDLSKRVEQLKIYTDTISKSGSLKEVEDHLEVVITMGTWIKNTRIEVTKPLDGIKKEFTAIDTQFKNMTESIKNSIRILKENDFQKAELNIKNEFTRLLDESEVDFDLNVFADFIRVKRENSGMLKLGKNGELGAGSKKIIKEQFDFVANPIIEAKQIEKQKENEYKHFSHALENATEVSQLDDLRAFVPTMYPNIKESANLAIQAKLDAITIRKLQSEKAERLEKQKSEDAKALEVCKKIFNLSAGIKDREQLADLVQKLKVERDKCIDNKVIAQISDYASKIRGEIETLNEIERQKGLQKSIKKVEATKKIDKFKLSSFDIEVIGNMTSKKDNIEEAKTDIISQIKTHFIMSKLEKI